jgi:hypothetical protein
MDAKLQFRCKYPIINLAIKGFGAQTQVIIPNFVVPAYQRACLKIGSTQFNGISRPGTALLKACKIAIDQKLQKH